MATATKVNIRPLEDRIVVQPGEGDQVAHAAFTPGELHHHLQARRVAERLEHGGFGAQGGLF